jgi:hypothetical protein
VISVLDEDLVNVLEADVGGLRVEEIDDGDERELLGPGIGSG